MNTWLSQFVACCLTNAGRQVRVKPGCAQSERNIQSTCTRPRGCNTEASYSVITLAVIIAAAGVAQLMQLAAASSCQSYSCRWEDVNVLKVAIAYCHYRGYLTLLSMFSGLNTPPKKQRQSWTKDKKTPTAEPSCLNLEDFKPCLNCFPCHLGCSRLGFVAWLIVLRDQCHQVFVCVCVCVGGSGD